MPVENGPVQDFAFEDWLRDGIKGFRRKMKFQKREFDTSAFRTHMRNARREQLLALRSLIDSGLDFITRTEDTERAEEVKEEVKAKTKGVL